MSWFKRLFHRPGFKQGGVGFVEEPPLDLGGPLAPRIPQEGFLADWRVGDLGRCETKGTWYHPEDGPVEGPKNGQIVRVTGVAIVLGCACLSLRGWTGMWQARCFHKLDEKGEGELVERIKKIPAPGKRRELTDA